MNPRLVRTVGMAVGTIVVIGLLAFTVFPTRTWLDQRAAEAKAREHLEVLAHENTALEERVEALDRDSKIEQLAREQYNLVRPGEEAYAVLPPPLVEVDLPAIFPFGELIPPAVTDEADSAGVPRDE